MKQKKVTTIVSWIVGIIIFAVILRFLGAGALSSIYEQAQPVYLIPYAICAFLVVSFLAVKLKYILKTYKHKIPFPSVLRYTVAGFAVSHVTPSARIGGEPLKTYMMHKEHNVPLKVGGSSVVIDKFTELLGALIVTVVGFFLLFLIPGVSTNTRFILFGIIIFVFFVLFFIYYWTINGKGPFTTLFNLLRFYKFKRFKKSLKLVKGIEERMKEFFTHHKKEFFISFSIYGVVVVFGLLEFYFLLLALGVKASLMELILAHVVLGISSFIPVPAGLGFQEAGHSGLFALLRKASGLGLVFSLIIRIRNLIVTGIGFIIITNFSSREIMKKYYKNSNNLKTK